MAQVPSSSSSSSNNMNNKDKYKDLPLVPESVLKKRHDLDDLVRKRIATEQVQAKRKAELYRGKKKAFYVKKPETFVARARSRRNHALRYQRVMRKGMQKRASNKPVMTVRKRDRDDEDDDDADADAERQEEYYQSNSVGAPMVFCVRIRNYVGCPVSVRKTLDRLGLSTIRDGVFLRYDEYARKSLHLVEPWVVYGRPSASLMTDLVERRGYARGGEDGKTRVPLSNNTVIEEALGEKHNILCVGDLIHELHSVGRAFDEAAAFLWPIRLADSKTEFERRTLKITDGKNYGDCGEGINDYIKQVL